MDKIILGAGGHAKVVTECCQVNGFQDLQAKEFFGLKKFIDIPISAELIIGFGGITVSQLRRRQGVYEGYNNDFIIATHPSAVISAHAIICRGAMIGPRAIINSGAVIHANAIINSGAIIEHDAIIGEGSHIAPGAIVLGGAQIGRTCMIGAGAVILQGTLVPDNTMIKALRIYKGED